MSTTRHHADWLSLVEVSGPFVSLPVLMRTFPQGLEPRDPVQAKVLRAAYDEWQDNITAPGKQRSWVKHVLTSVLGYPESQITEGQTLPAGLEASMPEMGETLRPDFALVSPADTATAGQPQLLMASYPAEQDLDKPLIGKHWKATPASRMMELLHATNVPLGLVTNGEQWMLVYAPRGETTGYASWYGALWLDEPITLRAFHSLLGVRRFFGVASDSTLSALLTESAIDQQEVTDQLGYQVREAVEVLVQAFDALNQESQRARFEGVVPATVYDAALTVMMRLVFLFSAEERGLLHLGKPLYDDNYAVSTLQEQLQEVADRFGEEVLERRYDAWVRLLATFRAVHGGIRHQDLLMQAYGGSLFDPDRYSFLEGRAAGSQWRTTPAEPLAVNNRVVLHLLNSLQRLRTKAGGGMAETRRVSFRALGVEQIGHVYEGLLDHTTVCATEVVLGIRGTRKKEPEIALSKLEALLTQGEDTLLDHLNEETDRSLPALRRELRNGSMLDEHKLLLASNHDPAVVARLRPFAGLIREDSFERPCVVLPGSIFVTEATTRRSTGTHYTPPSLTEPIVQHALEPLVYVGPAEGLAKEHWKLKLPKELLDLKVCDMAMGSGAFLVQVCRYLAERLVEAWENEETAHPGQILITPDGQFSEGSPSERLVPAQAGERMAIARRVVADRCLYGVDINPMAVEMAKLSMWLVTVDANRPFTFLDHAFKCGDSLLGITSLEQMENFSMRSDGGRQQAFGTLNLWRHIEEAKKKREALEAMSSDTPEQVATKAALFSEAEEAVAKLHAAADVLLAVELKGLKGKIYEGERELAADHMMAYWARGLTELQNYARQRLGNRQGFHWALAFPEIVERGGFHAFVGNPPFLGGQKITGALGTDYRDYLVAQLAQGRKGSADLCAYFFLRGARLLRPEGVAGMVATNTIAQGDTREVGLDQICSREVSLFRANPSRPWPGLASLEVAHIWMKRGSWGGSFYLNDENVRGITSSLTMPGEVVGRPYTLAANLKKCFKGSEVGGMEAFVFSEKSLRSLSTMDEGALGVVLKPFVGYEDLVANHSQSSERHCIYFSDWTLERASEYPACLDHVRSHSPNPARSNWWRFRRSTPELYAAIANNERVLVIGETSDAVAPIFVSNGQIYTKTLIVFATDSWCTFGLIASSIHYAWVLEHGSTLKTWAKYIITDCFETFPFPEDVSSLRLTGEQFHLMRSEIMRERQIGFTALYGLFHDPACDGADVSALRSMQESLDREVVAAYRWANVKLEYGFNKTKQGLRYTLSEQSRGHIIDRLLALNHKRHAEEVAAAAAQAAATHPKRGRKKKNLGGQTAMGFETE